MPLNGLTVASRGGNRVDAGDVSDPLIPKEGDGGLGAGPSNLTDLIPFANPDFFDICEAELPLDPAIAGHDDVGVFSDDVVGF